MKRGAVVVGKNGEEGGLEGGVFLSFSLPKNPKCGLWIKYGCKEQFMWVQGAISFCFSTWAG